MVCGAEFDIEFMSHNVQSQSKMIEFLMLLLPGSIMFLSSFPVPLVVKLEVIVVAMKTE